MNLDELLLLQSSTVRKDDEISLTGWQVPEDIGEDEWIIKMKKAARYEAAVYWIIGDGWRAGERMEYAKGQETADLLGINLQTAMDAAWVCGKVPFSRRRENVSFNMHKEIAALDESDQEQFLNLIGERANISHRDLRALIAKHKLSKRHASIADASTPTRISGRYALIYADPPWTFETFSVLGKEISPEQHYGCMTIDAIKALEIDGKPLPQLADEDAGLFLWCTSSNIHLALEVMSAWEFEYKTQAIWDKQRTGTGYIFLNQHEILLYGSRGTFPRPERIFPSVFSYPRGRHSAKPPEIRATLDAMYPHYAASNKIELFCRDKLDGWTTWGLEA